MIQLISSGKGAVLSGQIAADLYLDCRIITNPFRDPILGGLTGDDQKVQEWLLIHNHNIIRDFVRLVIKGLETRGTRNSGKDPSKPFRVCFFCLAGVHRSRGMKHVVAKFLRDLEYQVEVV